MSGISIKPQSTSLAPGASFRFEAVDEAGAPVAVTWSVIPDALETAGSIDETGEYRAPAKIPADQSITIKATDNAEASQTAEASVKLLPAPAVPPAPPPPETATVPPAPPPAPPAPLVKVTPETPVLGAGQTMRFQAADASGTPVSVSWALAGPDALEPELVGSLDSTTGTYTGYTAPADVTIQRFLTVTATGADASDKALVVLAPGKVTIVPGEVILSAGQQQVFKTRVSGDPQEGVTWAAPSPTLGSFDGKGGYTAPDKIPEDQTVMITAISNASGDQGRARVTLLADPWTGSGPRRLGIWLIFLSVVAVIVGAWWPPPLDRSKLNTAVAAQVEAERALNQRHAELAKARARATRLAEQRAPAAQAEAALANEEVRTRVAETNLAVQDHRNKSEAARLEKANFKQARLDERHILLLVVLTGALGSFVHVTRSFVEFLGNRRLRPSWTWWYVLQPFTAAALAVVVYLVIRGGFFSGTPAGGSSNPFGFVAMAALVGLFSRQAISKLDELFSTLFRTDKDRELKDKLESRGSKAKEE